MTRGIDIARYQGYPDWNAVRRSDVHYVYIKATEGTTYVSTHVDEQWAGASRVGLPRGLYHYARIGNPEAEADLFSRLVNAKGAKGAGFLPPCLDIEVGDGHLGWWVARFLARLRAAIGVRRVMVYSGGVFYRDKVGDAALDPDVLVWIAHYNGTPGKSAYLTPKTVLHQYSSSGRVAGISGDVDLNWALRPLSEITHAAPGGIESMAFHDRFKDWAGNEQTVLGWMNHIDERLARLHHVFLQPGAEPSRIPGDNNRTNLRDMIMDSGSWTNQTLRELRAHRAAVETLSRLLAEREGLDADEVATKVKSAIEEGLAEGIGTTVPARAHDDEKT